MKRYHNIESVIAIMLLGGVTVWLALVLAKMYGSFPGISWLLLGCGLVWIPLVLVSLTFLIVWLAELIINLKEYDYQYHTYKTLKDAMHGMTLNTIGPIYGVERLPGETNRYFEFRILVAATKGNKIYVKKLKPKPRPATGAKLDKVASKYGLQRHHNESDTHLQDRVREAVMKRLDEKLEGGKA
mgnify:CR=1 FL=1